MHVTLHLTARCNLRCRYCYAAPHAGGDMTVDTMRTAVDFALAQRSEETGESVGISFYGGEPLLMRELIVETVRYCRQINATTGQFFHFKCTTNGTLLDKDFLTGSETGHIFVALSHDGIQAAHDKHRVDAAGAGSFDRVEAAAALLLRHKPYAPVMLTVTPETVAHYAGSVQHLYGLGFRYLFAVPHYAGAWENNYLRELRRQYQALARWYEAETLREAKFYFSPFEAKIASHVLPGSCKKGRCDFGRRQISVAPNGRLYPCVQFVGDGTGEEYCVGDVRHGIDAEKHACLYRVNAADKPDCAGCTIQERCNHFCGCLNWQSTGALDRVAPAVCAHERLVLPIADRLAARLFKKRSSLFIQKHYNDLYPLLSLLDDEAKK